MRGHEFLIGLRRKGWKPAMVFIDTQPDPARSWRLWPQVDLDFPQVEVLPDDALSSLDLRFLVGLRVLITGRDQRRVERLKDMCFDAGAACVVATVFHGEDSAAITTSSSKDKS